MSTNQATRQRSAPELALRMRKSAAILTRAACLLASDAQLPNGMAVRKLAMTAILRIAGRELFPRDLLRNSEDEPRAWAFAFALIPQNPMDQPPAFADLVRAARKLRRMADAEEHPLPTAAELRAAERSIRALWTRHLEFSDQITVRAASAGFTVSVLHFDGSTHHLLEAQSLAELVAAAKKSKADSDPAAKLRAEAERLGMRLVERGAA